MEKGEKKMTKEEKKEQFIKQLAKFLVADQVHKSIQLQIGKLEAKQWAELRQTTPLFGHPTIEEAEKCLTEFLQ